jgi:hypothetical protein
MASQSTGDSSAGVGASLPRRAVFWLLAAVALTWSSPGCRRDRARAGGGETVALTQAQNDSLEMSLVVPSRAAVGSALTFKLQVRNREPRPLDLYLRGRTTTFDVIVMGPEAQTDTVWRRLEGEIIPAIVHLRTLAPDEGLELETRWDLRTRHGKSVVPGAYTARALLLLESGTIEAPAAGFRIE